PEREPEGDFARFSKILSVDVSDNPDLNSNLGLLGILGYMSAATQVTATNTGFTGPTDIKPWPQDIKFPAVTDFNIQRNPNFGNKGLNSVFMVMPNLKTMYVADSGIQAPTENDPWPKHASRVVDLEIG